MPRRAETLLRRFLRQQRAAGPLSKQVPWWGWISNRTLLTRAGELLTLHRLEPCPRAATGQRRQDQAIGRWARMLNALPPGARCQVAFLRTPLRPGRPPALGGPLAREVQRRRMEHVAARCFSTRTYASWTLDPDLAADTDQLPWLRRLPALLHPSRRRAAKQVRRAALERARQDFERTTDALAAMLEDFTPCQPMPRDESTALLSELLNGPAAIPPRPAARALYWRIALSPVEVYSRQLRIGGLRTALYSMQSPPAVCWRDMLPAVWELPCQTTCVWSYRALGADESRRRIRSLARAYNRRRFSTLAAIQGQEGAATTMEDQGAAEAAAELQAALAELSAGVLWGETSLTFALHGEEVDIRAAEATLLRSFAAVDGKATRETYGAAAAYFGRLPGKPAADHPRNVMASTPAAACLAPLFGSSSGHRVCRHLDGKPPLAVLETRQRSPYYYDLFAGSDVGHTLILGATGSGKSFLLNFLLLQSLQYKPRVAVLDLGGSYESVTALAGGSLLRVGAAAGVALSPFALPDNAATHRFLGRFVLRLCRQGGVSLDGGELSDVADKVADVYSLPPPMRTLSQLRDVLEPRLKPGLAEWTDEGPWASVFDRPPDGSLSIADWQVVDLAGCAQHPELAGAALVFFLERFRQLIEDEDEPARLKILVVDEAWRFLAEPETARYLAEAAKTWRKRNACLWLATQSGEDLVLGDRAPALLDSLANRLYLANPDMSDAIGELLQLSPRERETIRGLRSKREIYLRRSGEREVLALDVDSSSYWLYTSNPMEGSRRTRAIERHGLRRALELLARER